MDWKTNMKILPVGKILMRQRWERKLERINSKSIRKFIIHAVIAERGRNDLQVIELSTGIERRTLPDSCGAVGARRVSGMNLAAQHVVVVGFQDHSPTEKLVRAWDPQSIGGMYKKREQPINNQTFECHGTFQILYRTFGDRKRFATVRKTDWRCGALSWTQLPVWSQSEETFTHARSQKVYLSCTLSQRAVWFCLPSNSRVNKIERLGFQETTDSVEDGGRDWVLDEWREQIGTKKDPRRRETLGWGVCGEDNRK